MQLLETPEVTSVRSSNLMRQVNAKLRVLSDGFDTDHPIGFFCECTAVDCYAVLWLSAAAFEAHETRANGGWLLAPGHEASRATVPIAAVIPSEVASVSAEARGRRSRRWLSAARSAVIRVAPRTVAHGDSARTVAG